MFCPTYREEFTQTSSPRGRLNILRAWSEGKLPPSSNLIEQVYRCLGCGACTTICPSGTPAAELILEAREFLKRGGIPAASRRHLLDNLNLDSKRLHWASFLLRLYHTLGVRDLARSLGLLRLLPKSLREAESLLPPMPARALSDLLPRVLPPPGQVKGRVSYFIGCVNNFVLIDVGLATVKVLNHLGYEVMIPPGMGCCGMPARTYGETEIAEGLAKHNIGLFEQAGGEAIIADCASCGHSLKQYAQIFEDDPLWAEPAASFSSKVKDINEFLAPLELPFATPLAGVVTYHDPCHLVRGQNLKAAPRQLLKSVTGLHWVEMAESDWCCGNAGSYLLTHPDLSLAILRRKMNNIRATGANLIATSCPACLMQLGLGVKRFGPEARVVHPVQLLAQALGLIPSQEKSHAKV